MFSSNRSIDREKRRLLRNRRDKKPIFTRAIGLTTEIGSGDDFEDTGRTALDSAPIRRIESRIRPREKRCGSRNKLFLSRRVRARVCVCVCVSTKISASAYVHQSDRHFRNCLSDFNGQLSANLCTAKFHRLGDVRDP